MDEIDGMNNGDKGGINSLIKLIRPKKTKKQREEILSMNPIICIGNSHVDKKIKELMHVCNTLCLNTPSSTQISSILNETIDIKKYNISKILTFINNDLRKLNLIINATHKTNITHSTLDGLFTNNSIIDDVKSQTKSLLNEESSMEHHIKINETDRTIIGLLWHENVIDILDKMGGNNLDLYLKILENISFADYIDRITFQKQIWEFNEMSSLIKTMYNNKILHESNVHNHAVTDIRFTKVLTKYSTEYNNMVFVTSVCQKLMMDKNDLLHYFIDLQESHTFNEIVEKMIPCELGKLDISRLYKYLNVVKYGEPIEDICFD